MQPPLSRRSPENPAASSKFALLWAIGRLMLLMALVFLLRQPLLDGIERVFDIVGITEFVIDLASTPLSRLVLAVAAASAFFIAALASARVMRRHAYPVALACASFGTAVFVWKAGGGPLVVAVPAFLLATNWASLTALRRIGVGTGAIHRLIAIPPGIAEVFFTSRYLDWLGALFRGKQLETQAETPRMAVGALIAGLAVACLIPGEKLVQFEQMARSGPDVRVFAGGDYNGLIYEARTKRLLATGHGVRNVFGFDTADLAKPPLMADVETGFAQGMTCDPALGELYVFNSYERKILVLDSGTLALKRTIAAPDISPGDSWIEVDPISGTLTIASEADEVKGSPFVVMDRTSGAVLDVRDDQAGNILVHPEAPVLYMSFFRRVGGVVAYDLATRKVLGNAPTDARMDRMAYDPARRQLLIASPAEGRIQRFDAATLAPRGSFKAIAGARVIALDAPNDAMLVGSLITGRVALMNLSDLKVKRVWYLGPWLRSIVIAPGTGTAYVSSQKALYELNYNHRNR